MAEVIPILETLTTIWAVVTTILYIASPFVGALLGYILGVRRTRTERREERRENAIADVFGASRRHYRLCIRWANIGRDCKTRESVYANFYDFVDCFYERSIWLDKDTRELTQKYAKAATTFQEKLERMSPEGFLAGGTTKATEVLDNELTPAFDALEDKLNAEMDKKPPWYERLLGR